MHVGTVSSFCLRSLLMEDNHRKMEKFIKACEEGHHAEVKKMLTHISMPNFPRKELEAKFKSPLYWACKGGSLQVVKTVIEKYPGCIINETCNYFLYVACARGHVDVVQFLCDKYSIDPTKPNERGMTPIFAATNKGHFEMVKFLIYKLRCDPKSLNSEGESLLHLACDRNHLAIARYLVEEQKLEPGLTSTYKKTPLHSACGSGSFSTMKYLIDELHCDAQVFDKSGNTPLHIACRNGYADIVQFFVEHKFDLDLFDSSGYTPLHLGCRYGRKDVIKALLARGKVDPDILTVTGCTPLQITKDEDMIKELIRGGACTCGTELSIFHDYKLKHPLQSIVHVFMIGHSESGKSTLAKALQQSTHLFNFGGRNMQAEAHTVGVIPIEFDSTEFGKVLLYDFAGDYEFHPSHAALLEHSKFTSPPLFILVVNLWDGFEKSKRRINYWIQFVENHSIPEVSSPHIFVIGSHIDRLSKNDILATSIEEHVRSRLKSSSLLFDGYFSIDCRAPSKQALFRTNMKQSCKHLRSLLKEKFDPACHVLRALLATSFQDHFACTIQDVIEKVHESLDLPLPVQAECLCKLSEALSARTKILFLRNYDEPKKSWIVLDIYALLHNINGKIFAPKGFTESVFKPTNTGILRWSQLSKEFPNLDPSLIVAFLGRLEFCQVISDWEVLHLIEGKVSLMGQSLCVSPGFDKDIDTDLPRVKNPSDHISVNKVPCEATAVQPRCEELPNTRPIQSLSQLNNPHQYNSYPSPMSPHSSVGSPKFYSSLELKEAYLFFPGLISPEQPKKDMWSAGVFGFYSGWCLKCENDQQFFSLRFLQILLLRLSFSFAVTKSANSLCQPSECTLWKNGLRWLNLDGIETIVEMVEDRKAVLLLIRMKEASIMRGLHLRAAIIRKILDTNKEYCMGIVTSESFIHPSHLKARCGYPVINQRVDELKRYNISRIAGAFCAHSSFVYDNGATDFIEVDKLIKFDPYMCLNDTLLQKLYQNDEQDLDQDFLWNFSTCYPDNIMAANFERVLFGDQSQSPVSVPAQSSFPNPCFAVLHRFWDNGPWTFADFRGKLDKYSIFCGRNLHDVT